MLRLKPCSSLCEGACQPTSSLPFIEGKEGIHSCREIVTFELFFLRGGIKKELILNEFDERRARQASLM